MYRRSRIAALSLVAAGTTIGALGCGTEVKGGGADCLEGKCDIGAVCEIDTDNDTPEQAMLIDSITDGSGEAGRFPGTMHQYPGDTDWYAIEIEDTGLGRFEPWARISMDVLDFNNSETYTLCATYGLKDGSNYAPVDCTTKLIGPNYEPKLVAETTDYDDAVWGLPKGTESSEFSGWDGCCVTVRGIDKVYTGVWEGSAEVTLRGMERLGDDDSGVLYIRVGTPASQEPVNLCRGYTIEYGGSAQEDL